ncbi:MAG: hypothetical protein KGN16_11695 [Burkholderiales bacterium]|nr:hypothetical protein [Burkholderiales bacterium]
MRLRAFDAAARMRAGLAPSLPPGLTALGRLHDEARAGVAATLAPQAFVALLESGADLGYGEVCDLLATATALRPD